VGGVGAYIDQGVAAPDGNEFTIDAFRAVHGGSGRTPTSLFTLVTRLLRHGTRWIVRAQPWPARRLNRVEWTRLVETWDEAVTLCSELTRLIESGQWAPGNGEPPVS
jgi:hypothetical protein